MAPTDVSRLTAAIARNSPAPTTPVSEIRCAHQAQAARYPVIEGVTVTAAVVAGRPAEVITPSECSAGRTVLYVHGGGYVSGSPATARALVARIATAAQATAYAIDYRLAPEHPCPAATMDVVSAYEWLLSQGSEPASTAIAGDSAGGGLVVSACVAIRDRNLPIPTAAVCLSPWVDLTLSSGSITSAPGDPECHPAFLGAMATHYLAGQQPDLPGVSPLYADLVGLPSFLIHVGQVEALLDDSVGLAERLTTAGVSVVLEQWEAMIHVWHRFAPRLPEAVEAIDRIGEWLNDRLTPCTMGDERGRSGLNVVVDKGD